MVHLKSKNTLTLVIGEETDKNYGLARSLSTLGYVELTLPSYFMFV